MTKGDRKRAKRERDRLEWEARFKSVQRAGYSIFRSLRAGPDSTWSYKYKGIEIEPGLGWEGEYQVMLYLEQKINAAASDKAE